MEIHLTPGAARMLYNMFYQPQKLTEDKPFNASTLDMAGAYEVAHIFKWLKNKVFVTIQVPQYTEDGKTILDPETGNPLLQDVFKFVEYKGKIKNKYCMRIKQIAEHYKKSGMLITNCEDYMDLIKTLDGENQDMSVEE